MIYVSLMRWADSRMNSVCMCVSRLGIRKSSALCVLYQCCCVSFSLSLSLCLSVVTPVAPPQRRVFTVLSM